LALRLPGTRGETGTIFFCSELHIDTAIEPAAQSLQDHTAT